MDAQHKKISISHLNSGAVPSRDGKAHLSDNTPAPLQICSHKNSGPNGPESGSPHTPEDSPAMINLDSCCSSFSLHLIS